MKMKVALRCVLFLLKRNPGKLFQTKINARGVVGQKKMRTRTGKTYGQLGWLRSGSSRVVTKVAKVAKVANAATVDTTVVATTTTTTSLSLSVSRQQKNTVTVVPFVSFTRDGTLTPYLGKEPWTCVKTTSRAQVWGGKDWSVCPWDDVLGKTHFVARFRARGGDHVVHVGDSDATVEFLIGCLNEVSPVAVRGVATPKFSLVENKTMTLRELATREGRGYTTSDIAEIVVFT